ncbi:hypothetical protein BDV3_006742 [Batrachochytrium dendrobatidis]|uniref:Putative lipoate-protein ligase A n=1 Tax=Batrachochytrium dendrobatidis (strain JEL423) TaxID=403673 RepID=A0A177WRB6_BATDL|nr:hypothetical protein O5D80_008502 [Batrachochytrium dendrobatidis]KAK5665694.1 hypothetical protein QVD99_007339 [Batrachochytrium dendrobatidis]OAJ42633.1 hypothetical protein BDEG_26063 [Batrachochytrium dendrobatidis JEL423]
MTTWARQSAVFVSKVTDPWINLAFEDWLFNTQKQFKYQLMLYRNVSSVIVGRNQNPWRECSVLALDRDNIPIIRRKSGGGTVFHDMGNTNYSIMMPRDEFDRKRNAHLVSRALHQMDVPSQVNARHDIVIGDRKVSGSAFKLVNHRAYHHGTMLISTDISKLGAYLKGPEQGQIVGRGVESVKSQVTSLLNHSYTADHDGFCKCVAQEFEMEYSENPIPATFLTMDDFHASKEVQDIYHTLKSWEWTFGETSQFVHTIPSGQAEKNIAITVLEGIITDVQLIHRASSDPHADSRTAQWIGKRYDANMPLCIQQSLF